MPGQMVGNKQRRFPGVEPTGKKVDLRIAYFLFTKEGKIVRITEFYDLATLLIQQGQLEI